MQKTVEKQKQNKALGQSDSQTLKYCFGTLKTAIQQPWNTVINQGISPFHRESNVEYWCDFPEK